MVFGALGLKSAPEVDQLDDRVSEGDEANVEDFV